MSKELSPYKIDAIRRACSHYTDSKQRWETMAKTGATNDELTEHLNREMSRGGSCGPGWLPESHNNYPPRIWFSHTQEGDPHLSGLALLAAVRQVFGVHWKPHQDQLSLFE